MDNLPPIDFYSFDQVAALDLDNPMHVDPREGYSFDYDQVECPVDAQHHDFTIEVYEDHICIGTISTKKRGD